MGKPIIIMEQGNIDRKALKKAQIDINDVLTQAREQGYFDLSDIDCAIMEDNGKISFLPKPLKRPLNPKDFNLSPSRSGICTNLIVDGIVMEENLISAKVSQKQLNKILSQRNLKAEEVLLLTMDESGQIQVFKNNNMPK